MPIQPVTGLFMRRHFVLLSALLLLPACGSTMDGQSQEITLLTPGAIEADCYLENPDYKYRARTGETVRIMKSKHDLNVHCYAPGNREKSIVVEREITDWAIGNVATGIVPGVAYDHFSRGLYRYPDEIRVDFTTEIAKDYPLPSYHSPDIQNPWSQKIEYMGPGTAMLEKDKQSLPTPVQKRDENDLLFSNPFLNELSNRSPSSMTDMAPIGTGAAPSASSAPPTAGVAVAPSKAGTTAEDLTRSMNPQVFQQ